MRLILDGTSMALLSVLVACGTRATFQIEHEPRLAETTCVPALPAARANYPAVWATMQANAAAQCVQAGRGGGTITTVDFMNQYDKVGGAGPNDRIFQSINVVGVEQTTT